MSFVPSQQEYPITVIGNGITGLSTAWHLQERGFGPCRLLSAGLDNRASYHSPGYLSGGTWSNFTRHSHSYGLEIASHLWRFGDEAFEALVAYCQRQSVSLEKHRRVRLLTSPHELSEAKVAVAQLGQAGFSSRLLDPADLAGLGPRVLAVQDDGERGAWVDARKLLAQLEAGLDSAVDYRRVVAWSSEAAGEGAGLQLLLADGTRLHTEVLVLACHGEISHFLPELKEALVPVADQWAPCQWQSLRSPLADWAKPGLVFTAHHGYEWGVSTGGGAFAAGGCRYLRKLAGIGEQNPQFQPKVQKHLGVNLSEAFSWGEGFSYAAKKGVALFDIIPCDELPLIGPMYGSNRVLLATGYMGLGLNLGFYAGACLAELISTGLCPSLPRKFWPERLRSL